MVDIIENEPIEVRTFASIEDVRLLFDFKENNPLNKDNYNRIIGDYSLSDEVKCCSELSPGQLCGEGHKRGFVARLKDGSISIVGNICAKTKFGADAKINVDRRKYLNEKVRRERFVTLGNLLVGKETKLANLESLKEKLKEIQNRSRDFLLSLGERTRRRLQDMARTANTVIVVHAVTYRDYIDEDGNSRKEKRTSPTKLGSFNGLSVIDEPSFKSLYLSMHEIKQAFDMAEAIKENSKTSQLTLLINAINDIGRIEDEVGKFEKEQTLFFGNDFSFLCFLVDDKAERYKAAQAVLKQSGNAFGKEKAKSWLLEKDQKIKEILKAEKIEIQY